MISAVGNDIGFEHIYVRQLIAHGRAGDGLVGLSTSGNSANLIAAFVKAREMGLTTLRFGGGDGGRMASGVCDHCLVVPTTSVIASSVTSPPITFSGTWFTRCSPTIAARP
jgi:D-sedoheptulose 7-phosphate isomerase